MAIIEITLKEHSRDEITEHCRNLKNCSIHNCQPKVLRLVVGRSKDTYYVVTCKDDECTKISSFKNEAIAAWNNCNSDYIPAF